MVSQAFHRRTANLFATGSDGTFIERYVEMLPLSIHAPSGDRDEGFDLVVVGEFADSVIELFCRLISHLYRIFVGGRV